MEVRLTEKSLTKAARYGQQMEEQYELGMVPNHVDVLSVIELSRFVRALVLAKSDAARKELIARIPRSVYK